MKNTIVVLIVLLVSMPVFAQDARVTSGNQSKNNVLLFSSKNSTKWDTKHFNDLFTKQKLVKPATFVNSYTVFAPKVIGSNSISIHQQYLPVIAKSSTALEILGMIAGPVVGAFYPSYIGSIYHSGGASVQAYLQSTHYQHH